MAVRHIITAPDPRLKVKCGPVAQVDGSVRALMDDMLETMFSVPGIGLAAPQVGVHQRVIVVDAGGGAIEKREPMCFANPEILWASDETLACEEGCLSLPDQFAEVTRSAGIKLGYLDRDNEPQELDASGPLATCIQHEIDHLEGILFVDHLSVLKRNIILRKLVKARKSQAQKVAAGAGA
jgi:peptide deformylase